MTNLDELERGAPQRYGKQQHPGRRASDRVDTERVLAAGGEMGALMRAFDWSTTPLGPVAGWSEALRSMIGVLLRNPFPWLLFWGPRLVQLYNDASRPMLGAKHPKAMGQSASECWSEIWHIIGPMLEAPLAGQPATWSDDLLLLVDRKHFLEETHFKIAYSPVPDETIEATGIGGVLATVAETTELVYGERQLRTLRALGARAPAATTWQQACEMAAATFEENAFDVPFALFYIVERERTRARLASSCGFVAEDGSANPSVIELDVAASNASWPLRQILHTRTAVVVAELREKFGVLPSGRWSEPPRYAIGLPLASPETPDPYGVLIVGCSPHRQLDDGYRAFFELAAAQVVTAIRNANVYHTQRLQAGQLGAAPFVEEGLSWAPGNEPHDSVIPPSNSVSSLGTAQARSSSRVLVAEDSADMRGYIRCLLEPYWTVETVQDGAQALAVALANPPDLVLTDVMMPGVDGFELIRALRATEHTRTIPIMLLSARADQEAKLEGLDAGADDYVIKPFSSRELIARVRSQLDLSELRREAERDRLGYVAELRQTLLLTETLISVLGHDLRNPLSAISTATALVLRRAESEPVVKLVSLVSSSAQEMASMIDQLLDFARIRLGQGVTLEREEVDLTEICQTVAAESESAHACSIALETFGDLVGNWDRERLAQFVAALSDNSCRHRAVNTSVGMRLDGSRPDSVTLEVWNEGAIDADRLARIFDPAAEGVHRQPRDGGGGGLGLGLYISQQIVTAHGGTIRVESSEVQGTRFFVELPRGEQFADR